MIFFFFLAFWYTSLRWVCASLRCCVCPGEKRGWMVTLPGKSLAAKVGGWRRLAGGAPPTLRWAPSREAGRTSGRREVRVCAFFVVGWLLRLVRGLREQFLSVSYASLLLKKRDLATGRPVLSVGA